MNAIYAHSDHGTEQAANAIAATLSGAVVKFHKRRQRWDVLTPASEDGCTVISFGALPEATPEEVSAVERAAAEPVRFAFSPASEYASGAPMSWIIDGVLPKAELAIIYGAPGAGKSFLALDIAKSITGGTPWYGHETTSGKVAYICAEGGDGMRARVHAGKFNDSLHVARCAPNLADPKDVAALVHSMQQTGPYVAVVVDVLSRCHTGNENAGSDMSPVLNHCKFVHEKTGALVILISHTGKDESRGHRGWSGWKGAADVELEVTCTGEQRMWKTSKLKDGPDNLRGLFTLRRVTWELAGREINSCVVEHVKAQDASAFKPRGKIEVAAYEHVAKSGASRFAKKALIADVAEVCDSRPANVKRTLEKCALFMADGDDFVVLSGIIHDNKDWL